MTNKEALKKLKSSKVEEVVEGLKLLRDVGDPNSLEDIVDVLRRFQDVKIRQEASGLFNDLKDPKCTALIMDLIQKESDTSVKAMLVSSIWQGTLDYKEYTDRLINILTDDEYLVSIEAFTVLEAIIMDLEKDTKESVINTIKKAYMNASDEKQPLIKELLVSLS